MQTRTLLAGLAALTFVGAASADVIDILGDGGSITYTGTGVEFFVDENNIINQSGLDAALASDESNLATVSHGNASDTTAWVTDAPNGGTGDYFDPAGNGGTIVFDIDLGGTHTLDSMAAWGYGFGAPNGNGVSEVTLEFYTNGTGAGAADSTQNVSVASVFGTADIVALAPVSANFIRLTVTDNHFGADPGNPTFGGDRAGIAEIAFTNNVPEPGSLALLGLGGLMIARRRRG